MPPQAVHPYLGGSRAHRRSIDPDMVEGQLLIAVNETQSLLIDLLGILYFPFVLWGRLSGAMM